MSKLQDIIIERNKNGLSKINNTLEKIAKNTKTIAEQLIKQNALKKAEILVTSKDGYIVANNTIKNELEKLEKNKKEK